MTACKTDLEVALYSALRRIARYARPECLRRDAEQDYGLHPDEAVEMAYENVLTEAKRALRNVRPRSIANRPAAPAGTGESA